MYCPVCKDVELKMSERSGVEIDYCPNCRGIWLDRGELDKLIERAAAYEAQAQPPQPPQRTVIVDDDDYYDDDYKRKRGYDERSGSYNDPRYQQRRKKSFLGDLFDVFD